tara:strand:+ start:192 stop:362 length:171 start_codon:yes stop_codon:yes gene_type:complete
MNTDKKLDKTIEIIMPMFKEIDVFMKEQNKKNKDILNMIELLHKAVVLEKEIETIK